ncbi:uncharacterized protein LOC117295716 [Asterias rubens]|uniref:uncharacterized protein LOC117295716 n=1 Tax=Asterias rubens TaxID=7604 RepID=UPI001455B446|nr:uncharacterized protein LOC117295716 [Asterias rubens]XP_033634322.1 uncharacterized protein LOC117295716 [Asterias rubens]
MMDLKDNITTAVPPPEGGGVLPTGGGDGGSSGEENGQPTSGDQTTIPVAASAASLILVLVALVLWYFLVRGQLRKKSFDHQRSNSHQSHHSHQGSMRDSNSRHGSLGSSHGTRSHGNSPRSHRKNGNGSPRSKRNSRCTCQFEACSCSVRSSDSPLLKNSPKSSRNSGSECTGTSPFCPHSSKFRLHKLDIHMRDSMDSDFHPDEENTAGPSCSSRNSQACTCNAVQDNDVVVNIDAVVLSDGSQSNGDIGEACAPQVNCNNAADCSCTCRPVVSHAHCTCRVIHNPLDNNRVRNPKLGLNYSAPTLIGSSSESDFPGAEAL